eukprot:gene4248-5317_t
MGVENTPVIVSKEKIYKDLLINDLFCCTFVIGFDGKTIAYNKSPHMGEPDIIVKGFKNIKKFSTVQLNGENYQISMREKDRVVGHNDKKSCIVTKTKKAFIIGVYPKKLELAPRFNTDLNSSSSPLLLITPPPIITTTPTTTTSSYPPTFYPHHHHHHQHQHQPIFITSMQPTNNHITHSIPLHTIHNNMVIPVVTSTVPPTQIPPTTTTTTSSASTPNHISANKIQRSNTKETIRAHKTKDNHGYKMVNEYVIGKKLGRGTYGKVFLAYHQETNHLYAVKVFNKFRLKKKSLGFGKGNAYEDVLKEIAIMKKMDHPNVVRLYEVINDPDEECIYMVMEYVEGGAIMSTADFLSSNPMSENLARQYFRDIDDDLLKCSAGSPAFLAPELCNSDNKTPISGKAIDVWALGVSLYCLIFAKLPFQTDTNNLLDIYDIIQKQEVIFPREISNELRNLLNKLLDKNPSTRITISDIKIHPWTTIGGTWKMEELDHFVLSVTDLEVSNAITSDLNSVFKDYSSSMYSNKEDDELSSSEKLTGDNDTPPTLYINFGQFRYFFDCGESAQRLIRDLEGMTLTKVKAVFVTSLSWEAIGGLIEYVFAFNDASIDQINIYGPKGLHHIFTSSRDFTFLSFKIYIHEINNFSNQSLVMEDDMTVTSIPIFHLPKEEKLSGINYQISEVDTDAALCYIAATKDLPGKFHPEKAAALGVPKGILFKTLVDGQPVQSKTGETVYPHQVVDPATPGTKFAIIRCESEEYFDSFMSNEAFKPYFEGTFNMMAIYHFVPHHILSSKRYIEFMEKFGSSVKHIIANLENCQFYPSFQTSERQIVKFNGLAPNVFPIHKEDRPIIDLNTSLSGIASESLLSRLIPCQKVTRLYLSPISNIGSIEFIPLRGELKDELDTSIIENSMESQLLKLKIQEIESLKDKVEYPKILFTGTGSALPSKLRNVTGNYLGFENNMGMLLDAGEGTYGQMYRFFGPKTIQDIIIGVRIIWISHLHADHHLGIPRILIKREEFAKARGIENLPEVVVIGPPQLTRFLSGLSEVVPMRYHGVRILEESSVMNMTLKQMGIKSLKNVPVIHCVDAYGVVVEMVNGIKFCYSGDTRPCQLLAEEGKDSLFLIHEATFEDEKKEDAIQKNHSTISEAIEIGKEMKAKWTLLTHFSQRYSSLPPFSIDHSTFGLMFDKLLIAPYQFPLLPLMIKPLQDLFEEETEQKNTIKQNTQEKLDAIRQVKKCKLSALLISTANARTVRLDGKKCGAPACKLESLLGLLGGGALTAVDDIVIQGAANALVTISSAMTCRSMNITSGSINLNAKVDIKGALHIGAQATLLVDSSLALLSNLHVDGDLIIKSGVSTINNLNCNSCKMRLEGGSLTVNSLITTETAVTTLVGGILKHTGKCVYNTAPIINAAAQLHVDAASSLILNKGIFAAATALLNVAAKARVEIAADAKIASAVQLAADAVLQINKGKCELAAIKGAATSVLAVVDAHVNLNGISTCNALQVTGAGILNVNANAIVNTLTAAAAATVNVAASAALNVNLKADIAAKVNLAANAQLVVNSNAVANINAGIQATESAILKIMDNCKVNIAADSKFDTAIAVGAKSILNLASGVHTCAKGIQATADALVKLNADAVVHINADAKIGALNVDANAILNINAGSTIISGPFTCASKAVTTVANAALNIKGEATINSILNLDAKANVQIDALTTLAAGIKADATAILNVNSRLNLLAAADIKATANLNANAFLNLCGDAAVHTIANIKAAVGSTINLEKATTLKITGDAQLAGVNKICEGSHLIVEGVANIISGIQAVGAVASHVTVGKAAKCTIAAESTITGKLNVDIGANVNLNAKVNIGTSLTNNGILSITKPIAIAGEVFAQANANAVCNLVAGASIAAKVIDFTQGAVKGVGALTCGTCNFANVVDANLNIQGNVNLAATANLIANVNAAVAAKANAAVTFAPMIVATGAVALKGTVEVAANAAVNLAAGTVLKLVSAPSVTGALQVRAAASVNASANAAAGVWSLVYPPCHCECGLKYK